MYNSEGNYVYTYYLYILAEGEDFELSDPAEIVIPAKMTRGCLAVTILQSEVAEGEEEIRLAIDSTAVNATIITAETIIIVIAPDEGKTFHYPRCVCSYPRRACAARVL